MIENGASYMWGRYEAGEWKELEGETSSSLTVAGSEVPGMATFCCMMSYKDSLYPDFITLIDKTDNYQVEIISTGGDIFKNTVGTTQLLCVVYQNGQMVDEDGTEFTYLWGRFGADGEMLDEEYFATGKIIQVDGSHVDGKTTFICEVTK